MHIFESNFTKEYRQEEIKKILNYVLTGKFCQIVCIPGAGKATILRLLAHNRNILKFHLKEKETTVRFIYLNLYELPSFQENQIARFLLIALDQEPMATEDSIALTKQLHEAINKIADEGTTLVLLFDHFDEYQNKLPRSFFQTLRTANNLAKYKFAAVFATRRNLEELVDPQTLKDFYAFFIDNAVYLKIYDKLATSILFSQIEEVFKKKISQNDRDKIVTLTGGHAKLTKVVAEQVLREDVTPTVELLKNSTITAALFEIWLFLTAQEQQVLTLIANKSVPTQDTALENLVRFNLIAGDDDTKFTIPLFEEFIKTVLPNFAPQEITYDPNTKEITKGPNIISDLLSPQEYRLLKFLIENQGKIVGREEIIKSVWPDAQVSEGVSDEAIDQMLFRLRKKIEENPNQPKHIQTVKGQGFRFNS